MKVAVAGFSSRGRRDVRMSLVKDFDSADGAEWTQRIRTLRPGGSTRLGAALRHATRGLARSDGGVRLLLVLSDGQPHDIDVHDPQYLVEDASRAVRDASRASIRTVCLVFAGQGDGPARRIFGAGVQRIGEPRDLPQAIVRLLD